ncbi:MAG: 1-acyl-sn-glycerol-3-phosphate acyltransferase [Gemmatales bacterium]|nr:1-acyl-sn-glycerol-3-phosphate acyltransferase [Gemmatales bacterium]
MVRKNWWSASLFGATSGLGGWAAATLASRGSLPGFDWLAGGLALLSAGYGLIFARPLSGRIVRRWALVILPLLQAMSAALLAWSALPQHTLKSLLVVFWGMEWLVWFVRFVRSGALARELDAYPGLVVALMVLSWLAGWFVATFVPWADYLSAVIMLLLSSLLATRLNLRFESSGPEAVPEKAPRLWRIVPDLRLSSGRDVREALALVLGGALFGVISGMNWQAHGTNYGFGFDQQDQLNLPLPMYVLPWLIGLVPVIVANHPVRVSGWLPYLAWCSLVALGLQAPGKSAVGEWGFVILQSTGWCAMLAILSRLIALCPPSSVAGWLALANTAICGAACLGGWLGREYGVSAWAEFLFVAGAALAIQIYWLREWMELTAAPLAWLIYRIRHVGPGHPWVPWRGPLIVLANHAAWFDPLWLGKVIPRRLTPMMTSVFYDLPGLYWLMRYVLRVIRVQASAARQEVPELEEAVARLDQGECLVIFPEARLRREEHRLLAHFQRGIWLLLQKRPETQVVPCWIEGNWGSFFSWRGGPPMKGKLFDWGRTITIVIGEPLVVSSEALADHRTTRRFLEQTVLSLRQVLDNPDKTSPPLAQHLAKSGPDESGLSEENALGSHEAPNDREA